jgi:hypothetical protein
LSRICKLSEISWQLINNPLDASWNAFWRRAVEVAWPLRRLEAYRSGLPVVCFNVGREYKFLLQCHGFKTLIGGPRCDHCQAIDCGS